MRGRSFNPSTAISLLALFVALGGTAFAATGSGSAGDEQSPEATVAKALGTKNLKVRQASVAVDGGTFNANYNTRQVSVQCAKDEVALSVSTQWDAPDNTELVTSFARLTSNRAGRPTGAVARGGSDLPGVRIFRVQVLCAG